MNMDTLTTATGAPVDREVLRVLVETVNYWHGRVYMPELTAPAQKFLTDATANLHTYLTR